MKKLLAAAVIGLLSVVSFSAQAGEFGDLMAKVGAARSAVAAMIQHKDQRGAEQQKSLKDTADAVSATLAKLKAPAGKEAQFKELNETLAAFMKARDTEVVPLLLAGKDDEAKSLAGGVQKERFAKITALTGELDK